MIFIYTCCVSDVKNKSNIYFTVWNIATFFAPALPLSLTIFFLCKESWKARKVFFCVVLDFNYFNFKRFQLSD